MRYWVPGPSRCFAFRVGSFIVAIQTPAEDEASPHIAFHVRSLPFPFLQTMTVPFRGARRGHLVYEWVFGGVGSSRLTTTLVRHYQVGAQHRRPDGACWSFSGQSPSTLAVKATTSPRSIRRALDSFSSFFPLAQVAVMQRRRSWKTWREGFFRPLGAPTTDLPGFGSGFALLRRRKGQARDDSRTFLFFESTTSRAALIGPETWCVLFSGLGPRCRSASNGCCSGFFSVIGLWRGRS